MERTRISSGWKIAILGGCAFVAVCGMVIFALLLVSVLHSQSAQQPVYSESTSSDESVPQQEPDSASAVSDVLTGHRWMVHSPTLGTGVKLEAVFKDGGSFDGIITAPLAEIYLGLNK